MRALALIAVTISMIGCRDRDAAPTPLVSAQPPTPTTPAMPPAALPTGPLGDGETAAARVDAIMQAVDRGAHPNEADQLLIELGPAALPALLDQLRIVRPKPPGGVDRRYVIARALRVHGTAARAAIPLLAALLGGPDRPIDQPQPPGSNIKLAILENSELRNASAEALGAIGAEAVPALIDVLRGSDPVARTKAAAALDHMPAGTLEGLELAMADALVVALCDALPTMTEQLTQIRAIEALLRLPRRSAITAVPTLHSMSRLPYVGRVAVRVAAELSN